MRHGSTSRAWDTLQGGVLKAALRFVPTDKCRGCFKLWQGIDDLMGLSVCYH